MLQKILCKLAIEGTNIVDVDDQASFCQRKQADDFVLVITSFIPNILGEKVKKGKDERLLDY